MMCLRIILEQRPKLGTPNGALTGDLLQVGGFPSRRHTKQGRYESQSGLLEFQKTILYIVRGGMSFHPASTFSSTFQSYLQ